MGDVRGSGLAWAPGNAEALAAATSLAGDTFGVADRGWIAEGHLADLVLAVRYGALVVTGSTATCTASSRR